MRQLPASRTPSCVVVVEPAVYCGLGAWRSRCYWDVIRLASTLVFAGQLLASPHIVAHGETLQGSTRWRYAGDWAVPIHPPPSSSRMQQVSWAEGVGTLVERSTFPIGSSMSARNRMPCASCASLPSFIFSRFSSASSVPAASAAAMSAAFSARIAASFASRASATRRCHTSTHTRRPASSHRSLRTLLRARAGTRRTNAALRASVVSDCNPRDAARAAKAISVDNVSPSIVSPRLECLQGCVLLPYFLI
jgi:hypothetical protein